jgi:hypothetical protein
MQSLSAVIGLFRAHTRPSPPLLRRVRVRTRRMNIPVPYTPGARRGGQVDLLRFSS